MKFDYGTQLSPYPIKLSIGTLRKPKLQNIAKDLGFDKFGYYEFLIKMSPKTFYCELKGDEGKTYWESLSPEEQENITIYSILLQEEPLRNSFVNIFNFFFVEKVIFQEGYFVLLNNGIELSNDRTLQPEDVCGVISENIFEKVLNAIQQVCCIADQDEDINELKFKNNLAKKMFLKMQKAAKKDKEKQKSNPDFTIPNIISSVSNKHSTISPINVWDLTIFQLLDSFSRLQANTMFDIDSTRVSVWGDEKKTFNAALWYKNNYDK